MQHPIVLVTGVFDLLHAEHIAFLHKAHALGHTLLIGVESDARVRALKGEGRPVQTAAVRVNALADLNLADRIFILPEQFSTQADHRQLLAELKPDILAVSAHTLYQKEKRTLMEEIGGKVVVVHEHNPAVSTSKTLAALQK